MEATRHHLIGRDDELSRISGALAAGASVLLRGEPGIGKTALLHAHRRSASVEVVGTGDLPLSAFAHIGDAEWRQPTPAAVAAALYRSTVRKGTDLLIVDDAHVLDSASAGLVLQLARSGTPVLAAARAGLAIPRAMQAVLQQSGRTIEIGELSVEHVRALMQQQLDAPVSLAFATAVTARTDGNPLHVREVVDRVRAAGGAVLRRGVWVLSSPMPVLDVRDLLAERIERLPGRVRFALELLAVAGDLPLHELLAAVGEATVSLGAEEGVIRVADGIARPGHPLQRDAALAAMPAGRRGRVLATLLRVAHRDESTAAGAARRAVWRLDSGSEVEADELLDIAERVYSTSLSLSHRLADAAAGLVRRPDQAVRLGALWVNLGEGERADRVLEPVPGRFPPGLDVAALGLRAFAAWIVHDRPAEALRLLDEGVAELGAGPMLDSQRTAVLWRLGRIAEARELGERTAADRSSPPDTRSAAAATLHSIAAAAFDRRVLHERAAAVQDVLAESDRVLNDGRATFAITVAGRRVLHEEDLDWAEAHLRGDFTAALERGEEREAAQYGCMLGWSLALRGRPQEAVETMPEFLELGGPWAVVNRGWADACYIRALVAAGRTGAGREELARLRVRPLAPVCSPEVGLAEVDVLAAEGRRPAAIEHARRHRADALAMEAEFRALSLAWAELLLGGRGASRALVALARRSEHPLHELESAVAVAAETHDVPAALRAARSLLGLGHRWHALETVSLAATFPGASDAQNAEVRALHRELTDGQPEIRTRAPRPRFSGPATDLTAREREVAELVAQGLSDRDIAQRLVLSVRTVESHVAHVFAKTGLHRREDLTEVLGAG